jgi:hypothetical protein
MFQPVRSIKLQLIGGFQRGGREFTVHLFWPDNDLREDDTEYVEEGYDVVCSTDIIRTDDCVDR